ncbi:putative Ig domain-containing protein [Candidatus Magnetaquicoccus inordinatus]|uniref:putative Ig domain-containing protein n=1 Tax=Candidatus Magnetaquicoccus inordinatus TaxID=2496818 RepID=UPI00187D1CA7|nr:putative Ig domain-containing protein [Candidatus Magnetaquicoccus inordinatus]
MSIKPSPHTHSSVAAQLPESGGEQCVSVVDGAVLLPQAAYFLEGEFTRAGNDLLIDSPQGGLIRVLDYFQQQSLPIITAENGAFLLPESVALLLPLSANGLLVAAADGLVASDAAKAPEAAIGKVKSLTGAATARSQGGESRTLKEGDSLFEGEELRTAEGGQVQLQFVDGTLFQVGVNARVIINKFLYNPDAAQGEFGATVMKGAFAYSSGNLAKQHGGRHTLIKTPTAQIGVRGSALQGNVADDGKTDLLHQGGVIDVSDKNGQGTVTLLQPGTATIVTLDGGPAPVFTASQTFLDRLKSLLPVTLPGHQPENQSNQSSEAAHETVMMQSLLESYKESPLSSAIKTTLGLDLEKMTQAERVELVHDLRQLTAQLPPLPAPKLNTSHGVFLDSAVAGIRYQTATLSGITDANGGFSFKEGETVTFSIGGIVIGSANMRSSKSGLPIVTPTLLAEAASASEEVRYNVATNMIRLLQTLDSDGDPGNGISIQISEESMKAALGTEKLDLSRSVSEFEQQIEGNSALVQLLKESTAASEGQLVAEEKAWQHYQQTLTALESLDQVSVQTASFLFTAQGNSFSLSLAALFKGTEGSSLLYSVHMSQGEESPAWLHFDPQKLTISGTPGNIDVGLVVITISAALAESPLSTQSVNYLLMVDNVNDAPIAATLTEQAVNKGATWQWRADAFSDPDLALSVAGKAIDQLTYSATLADGSPLPDYIHFDADSRTFSSTALGNAEQYMLRLTATDRYGAHTSSDFRLTVNTPPTAEQALDNQTVNQHEALLYTLPADAFSDPDSWDSSLHLQYRATPIDSQQPDPTWLHFNPLTRQFYGTPGSADGDLLITVTASDSYAASVEESFQLHVQHVNHAPQSSGLNNRFQLAGQPFLLSLASAFSDLDQDVLSFSAMLADESPLPDWLSVSADGKLLATAAQAGELSIVVTASDGLASVTAAAFTLAVGSPPQAQTALSAQQLNQGESLHYTLPSDSFVDSDSWDQLRYSSSSLPEWLHFDAQNRIFTGTPRNEDIVDNLPITVTATDLAGGSASASFYLTVHNSNDAPYWSTPLSNISATQGKILQWLLPAVDPDSRWGDQLTFAAHLSSGAELPAWLSFDSSSGIFSGLPGRSDLGTLSIEVTATDQGVNGQNRLSVSGSFTIDVLAPSAAPLLLTPVADQQLLQAHNLLWQLPAESFRAASSGSVLSYSARLMDGSANGREIAVSGGDLWLHFDPLTRTLSGLPENDDVGSWQIKIIATDSLSGLATADNFAITVNNLNDAPSVVGEGLTSRLASPRASGESATTPTFSISWAEVLADFQDVDHNDRLSFSVTLQDGSPLPSWLHVASVNDPAGAFLYGTPTEADTGTLLGLKIIASDLGGLQAEDRFLLLVTPPNHAPQLAASIADKEALQGALFMYEVPQASFADLDLPNDRLRYQAWRVDGQGLLGALPSWLHFDADTHTFLGTPGNSNVGSLTLRVRATDWYGAPVESNDFTVTVANVNDAPQLLQSLSARTAIIGSAFGGFSVASAFNDPDLAYGDALTYSFAAVGGSLPSWLKMTQAGSFYAENHPLLNDADKGIYTIKVTASDALGAKVSDLFALNIQNPNHAPQLNSGKELSAQLNGRSAQQDQPFTFSVQADTFSDSDLGEQLTWSARLANGDALPSWLQFDSQAHTFLGVPRNSDVARSGSSFNIVLTATDRQGAFVEDSFLLQVQNRNDAPYRQVGTSLPNHSVTLGQGLAWTLESDLFTDPDGDPLTWSATLADGSALPVWLSFDSGTRLLSGSAPAEWDSTTGRTLAVKVTVSDGSLSASDLFTLTLNHAPTVSGPLTLANHAVQGQSFYYKLPQDLFQDADLAYGDQLTVSATLKDGTDLSAVGSWLRFDPSSKTLLALPGNAQVGTWDITLWATDKAGDSVRLTTQLQVDNVNDVPVIVVQAAEQVVESGSAFTLSLGRLFADPDLGDSLSHTLSVAGGGNGGLTLTADSAGNLTVQGTASQSSSEMAVKLTASDGAATVSQMFVLRALPANHAPTVDLAAIGDQSIVQNQLLFYRIPQGAFADSDGDRLQLSVTRADGSPLPSWLHFDAETGTLLGRPGNSDWQGMNIHADHSGASLELLAVATDPRGGQASDRFTLTVKNSNDAPTINPQESFTPLLVNQGSLFRYQIPAEHFLDADALFGDTLSWNVSLSGGGALPSWLVFDPVTRQLSGTPTTMGLLDLRVTVSDSQQASIADNLTIQIVPPNHQPTVASHLANLSVDEEKPFSWQIPLATFQDQDEGESLTLTAKLLNGLDLADPNSSFWLHFDPVTRTFYGTPQNGLYNGQLHDDVGSITIKVTATDSGNGNPAAKVAVSDSFELQINNINDAPLLRHSVATQAGEQGLRATSGQLFRLALATDTFIDPDAGDLLTLRADNLPDWLHFDAETATFTGTAGSSDQTVNIKLLATDSQNSSRADLFTIQVVDPNLAPVRNDTLADLQASQATPFRYQFSNSLFGDPEGAALRYTLTQADGSPLSNQSWLHFDSDTRTLSGLPGNADVGVWELKLLASDPLGASSATLFHINVSNSNDAPLLLHSLHNQGVVRGTTSSFRIDESSFADADTPYGDRLSWEAKQVDGSALPTWLTFDATSQLFTVTPGNDAQSLTISLQVTDQAGSKAADTFRLEVADTQEGLFLDSKVVNISYVTRNAQGVLTHSGVTNSEGAFLYDAPTDRVSFSIGGIALGTAQAGSVITPVHLAGSNNLNGITNMLRLLQTLDDNGIAEDGISISNQILSASADRSLNFNLSGSAFANAAGSYLTAVGKSGGLVSAESAWRHFLGTLSGLGSDGAGIFATSQDPLHSYDPFNPMVMQNSNLSYQAIPALFGLSREVKEWRLSRLDGSALPNKFWLSLDKDTGLFSGTPGNEDVGTLSLLLTAKTGKTVVSEVIDFTVLNRNDAPTYQAGSLSNQTVTKDKSFFYQLPANAFSDPDFAYGDRLSFSISRADGTQALPEWLHFDADTGTFSGTPTATGTTLLRVTASDKEGAAVAALFELKVNADNHAPVLNLGISQQNIPVAKEGTAFRWQLAANTFTDSDLGDTLTYSYSSSVVGGEGNRSASWLHFDADTRTFSGTPTAADVGAVTIKVSVTDNVGVKVSDSFTLDVQRLPHAPQLHLPIAEQLANQSFLLGEALRINLDKNSFTVDPGDQMTLSAALTDGSSLSTIGLTFDAATATITGIPNRVGSHHLRISALDSNNSLSTSDYFDLTVKAPNHAPTVNATVAWNAPILSEGSPFSYKLPTAHFYDANNDSLLFSASLLQGGALPAWLRFDAASNSLLGTPGSATAGSFVIKITASDSSAATVADSFTLVVNPVNHAPQLHADKLLPQTATVDSLFTYRLASDLFTDADAGSSLSYQSSIVKQGSSQPVSWLRFDADTASFSGRPGEGDLGSYQVTLSAQDQGGLHSDAGSFLIQVSAVNHAPIRTAVDVGSVPQAVEESAFQFTLPAGLFSDADAGDQLRLQVVNGLNGGALPAWLSFDNSTRMLSGTPNGAAVGTTPLKIIATDKAGLSVADSFNLTVLPLNKAPFVNQQIATQTLTEGSNWLFKLDSATFSDPNSGDSLTYSATLANGASLSSVGLSFDPLSLTFSGAPAVDQYNLLVKATDEGGLFASKQFILQVNHLNHAPTLDALPPTVTVQQGATLQLALPNALFSDGDGDPLQWSISSATAVALPHWLQFDAASRTLRSSRSLGNGDVGEYSIKLQVQDPSGESAFATLQIQVSNSNDAPLLQGSIADAPLATVGKSFIYALPSTLFADPDSGFGDTLQVSARLSNGDALPSWLQFDSRSLTFSALPSSSGSWEIVVKAQDQSGAFVADTFLLQAISSNSAPQLSNSLSNLNLQASRGQTFSYQFAANTFSDSDSGDQLRYEALQLNGNQLPTWLRFDREGCTQMQAVF